MKKIKIRIDYLSVIKYASIFLFFLIFNNLETEIMPYSAGLYVALLYSGCSLIVTPVLFITSFLVFAKTGLLLSASVFAMFFVFAFLIYRKFGSKPNYELIPLTVIALTPYLVVGDTSSASTDLIRRIYVSLIILALTFLIKFALTRFEKKGLKSKYAPHEKAVFAVMLILSGVGLSNLTSPLVFKAFAFFLVLTAAFLYKPGYCVFLSVCLGFSFSVYYGNVIFLSTFLALSVCAALLTPISRHLASASIVVCDLLLFALFNSYPNYGLWDVIAATIGALCYSFTPNNFLVNLKEKLYSFREKQLVRQSINRNRTLISNRLYELSTVFNEMSHAFHSFEQNAFNQEGACEAIQKNIEKSVCAVCQNKDKCLRSGKIKTDFAKLINVGFAKGKVSVIDLPKFLNDECIRPNDIIFPLNKLLAEYRAAIIEKQNVANGRKMLAEEAEGVAEVLRSLALESGSLLKYQSRLERLLADEIMKNGFNVSELLIYGEGESLCVGVIIAMQEIAVERLVKIISSVLKTEMCLTEKADITEGKVYFHLKKSPSFDAVFGVCAVTKNGSSASGDTHSVIRIKEDKFLVALSDGMGSGENARKISASSLSLIESFYKAGLSGELVLSTVNKLLAVNTDDSFTALDACVIDLKKANADFIKYGTPYGFIIGDEGIRIIEGNALPLGILTELKPAVCSANLSGGDMVLFVSDGVADAFGCSSEVLDFLKTVPAKNPQTLADDIVAKALSINNGIANDDMTALAVRIFKKQNDAA